MQDVVSPGFETETGGDWEEGVEGEEGGVIRIPDFRPSIWGTNNRPVRWRLSIPNEPVPGIHIFDTWNEAIQYLNGYYANKNKIEKQTTTTTCHTPQTQTPNQNQTLPNRCPRGSDTEPPNRS